MSELVDYTSEGFIAAYDKAGLRSYMYTQMYSDEDGIAPTGSYFIYCLDPVNGSCYFTVEHDNELGKWISTDAPGFIEHHFITWIGQLINDRKIIHINEIA